MRRRTDILSFLRVWKVPLSSTLNAWSFRSCVGVASAAVIFSPRRGKARHPDRRGRSHPREDEVLGFFAGLRGDAFWRRIVRVHGSSHSLQKERRAQSLVVGA